MDSVRHICEERQRLSAMILEVQRLRELVAKAEAEALSRCHRRETPLTKRSPRLDDAGAGNVTIAG
jgi:hypothetical protein